MQISSSKQVSCLMAEPSLLSTCSVLNITCLRMYRTGSNRRKQDVKMLRNEPHYLWWSSPFTVCDCSEPQERKPENGIRDHRRPQSPRCCFHSSPPSSRAWSTSSRQRPSPTHRVVRATRPSAVKLAHSNHTYGGACFLHWSSEELTYTV